MIEDKNIETKLLTEKNEQYSRRESVRLSRVDEREGEDVEKLVSRERCVCLFRFLHTKRFYI